MKNNLYFFFLLLLSTGFYQCSQPASEESAETEFQWVADTVADLRILRYQVPGWDQLSLQQKKLAYYLNQAGLAGRDIIYDQNYRHNLAIRKALETIVDNYEGDRTTPDWQALMTYAKRVWFSNGIHHHYGNDKFLPTFSRDYFQELVSATGASLSEDAISAMFDPNLDMKKVSSNAEGDLILQSATNFYAPDITQAEVEAYYKKRIDKSDKRPVSYGLNSRISRDPSGALVEDVYKADGLYGPAIQEMIKWLTLAAGVAENEAQKNAFDLLIQYYQTGDLRIWDEYNIAWAQTTEGDIDYINGFVEVYNDPLGYRGSFENIVQIKDFEASERMQVLSQNAQWFEDNSTISDEHKKSNVVGITYNVVNVAGESGDASPSTPIGVNLPNANWIREHFGSKSVSLGNITEAYEQASGGTILQEFAHDEEEIARIQEYGALGDKLSTALHEVIGHASGKLNPGIGTPKETLKSYASTLEEARADIVGLYFIMDPKLIELGLIPSLEVGKAEYDGYISNGLMKQLRRIEPGKDVEEAHMRNRQLIAAWVFEKGQPENVIEKVTRDGKTYYNITDYEKLRVLFGQLLQEIQRIKSEGDYLAGKALVESYGVKVDQALHKEVLDRVKPFNIPPYNGFIQPELVPEMDANGEIVDVKVTQPENFIQQMLDYGKKYGFLK